MIVFIRLVFNRSSQSFTSRSISSSSRKVKRTTFTLTRTTRESRKGNSGEVGEAFARHKKEEAAGKWREALKEAADLAGWELKNTANGHEAKFIRQIIEKLSLELRSIKVCIGKNLVGMETRINDIISSSGVASNDVSMIGIIGIGGGGKTTLAKTIFNKISFQFEGKAFIENVKEVSNASLSGLELLQNKVLSNVLNDKGIHVGSECEGKNMMSWMMRGRKKETVIIALESRGFHARIGLRVLEQTCLITINDDFDERVGMHDHLEEMAKNIIRRSHPDMPNQHSRLWNYKEIENILVNDLGTEATKGIHFFPLRFNAKVFMNGLRKMKELWFLDVVDLHLNLENDKLVPNFLNALGFLCCNWKFNKVSLYFPNSLRYLQWYNYPFRSLPETFEANNLVALHMANSGIVQLWEGGERKVFNKLKFLFLSGPKLRSLDLRLAPNLETLRLQRYGGLVELYMPRECLKLRSLELFDVKLRTLDLGLTPNLENLLLVSGDMVELYMLDRCLNLRSLNVDHSNLRTLDIGLTPNLEYLVLRSCYDLEELHMANECLKLRSLYLRGLKWRTLDLGPSPNLERLDLHKCTSLEIFRIYECPILTCIDISNLKLRTLDLRRVPNLSKLSLSECKVLVNLHLPHRCLNLRTIKFTNSWLRIFHLGHTPNLEELDLVKCDYLEEIQVVDECNKIVSLGLDHLKLWTLDLGLTPNLKKLHLKECYYLAQLHAPMGCLKNIVYFNLNGCLGFRSLFFNRRDDTSGRVHESLEVGPLAELHFTLERCPLHPDNNFPYFEFTCFHKEDIPSLTRGIEKLISEGQCACTKFETFSRSICGLQR
ncbi:unnamed protein product [Lactuca saligna]|uniref:Toll/interleukin-1 receptor (TIR) domain-containing protein n=1 Tax=Lactuca saligna TaxID=75948 RepID=A0AA36ERT7_LACSI|nr:unnamed protein product [Lactuca saligna]